MDLDSSEVVINLLGIEGNTIIACLAKEEYGSVYKLVPLIREQASKQIAEKKPADPGTFQIEFRFTAADIKQIVGVLNKHPFDQVYKLIEDIRTQVIPQLDAVENTEGQE